MGNGLATNPRLLCSQEWEAAPTPCQAMGHQAMIWLSFRKRWALRSPWSGVGLGIWDCLPISAPPEGFGIGSQDRHLVLWVVTWGLGPWRSNLTYRCKREGGAGKKSVALASKEMSWRRRSLNWGPALHRLPSRPGRIKPLATACEGPQKEQTSWEQATYGTEICIGPMASTLSGWHLDWQALSQGLAASFLVCPLVGSEHPRDVC